MQILDGKQVSSHRREIIKERVKTYLKKSGRIPGLAVVLVGEDPASHIYVKNKVKACEEVGMISFMHRPPADISQLDLEALIFSLNNDKNVDGILVQLPLPKHISEKRLLELIDPSKDADGFTHQNLGLLLSDQAVVAPCTPAGVMAMLEYYKVPLAGKNAVVVGRSLTVGKPMALLLLQANATVTICHSKTENMREMTKLADVVVVAAGKPQLLTSEDFKKGANVIDVGIHRIEIEGKVQIVGDVLWKGLEGHLKGASPVPGGVGPMTITMLLENTLRLAETYRPGKK
jgi:methylenetetrahydrofolate dehydrogenase (NADP+)/methenyltetrahydrofolate cyclohydrolase